MIRILSLDSGKNNVVFGDYSNINGGLWGTGACVTSSWKIVILSATFRTNYSFIPPLVLCSVNGEYSSILGGQSNFVGTTRYAAILGGFGNEGKQKVEYTTGDAAFR